MTKAELKRMDELVIRNERLEKKLLAVKSVLGRAIMWIAQSAGSPLSHADAQILLEDLDK